MTAELEIIPSWFVLSTLTTKILTFISRENLIHMIQAFRFNTILTERIVQVALGLMKESEVKQAYLSANFVHKKLQILKYDNIILSKVERRERMETALWTDRHLSLQAFLVKNRELFGVSPECEQYMVSAIKGVGYMKAMENGQIELLDVEGEYKISTNAQPYQLMSIVLRSDSLAMVDPKKNPDAKSKITSSKQTTIDNYTLKGTTIQSISENIRSDNPITAGNVHEIFPSYGVFDPDTITNAMNPLSLSENIDMSNLLSDEQKIGFLSSSYLLFKQLGRALPYATFRANQGNSWRHDRTINPYLTRLQAIQSNIIERSARYSDILGYIMAMCKAYDVVFPQFSTDGNSYHLGYTISSDIRSYRAFGEQIYEEFWDLQEFYQDLNCIYDSSTALQLTSQIKQQLLEYYLKIDQNYETKHASRDAIKYLSQQMSSHFANHPSLFEKWNLALSQDSETGQFVASPVHLFRITDRMETFFYQANYLTHLYSTYYRFNTNGRWSARNIYLSPYIDTLEKFAGSGSHRAAIFTPLPDFDGRSRESLLLGRFGMRKGSRPNLYYSELETMDLFNQECFNLFALYADDLIQYTNDWGKAMTYNALHLNCWSDDPSVVKPRDGNLLRWYDLFPIDDLPLTVIPTAFTRKTYPAIYQTHSGHDVDLRFRNIDELHFNAAFANLRYEMVQNRRTPVLSSSVNSKLFAMGGDRLFRSLVTNVLSQKAFADNLWCKRQSNPLDTLLKGIVPDDAIFFRKLLLSGWTLDTALIAEILDNRAGSRDWYSRQKQFDTYALLLCGLPILSIVSDPVQYSSYLEFPQGLTEFKNGKEVDIPKVIGLFNPLLMQYQVDLLGSIFKIPELTIQIIGNPAVPLYTLSFKEIMLSLDQIVVQNLASILEANSGFSQSQLLQTITKIQAAFGIQDGIIHDSLPIKRLVYRFTETGNLLPGEPTLQEYHIQMKAFWQAIDSVGLTKIQSYIPGLVGHTEGTLSNGQSFTAYLNILNYILTRRYQNYGVSFSPNSFFIKN